MGAISIFENNNSYIREFVIPDHYFNIERKSEIKLLYRELQFHSENEKPQEITNSYMKIAYPNELPNIRLLLSKNKKRADKKYQKLKMKTFEFNESEITLIQKALEHFERDCEKCGFNILSFFADDKRKAHKYAKQAAYIRRKFSAAVQEDKYLIYGINDCKIDILVNKEKVGSHVLHLLDKGDKDVRIRLPNGDVMTLNEFKEKFIDL